MHFHIDSVTNHSLSGWAIDPKQRPITIEIYSGETLLSRGVPSGERPDVARAYPNMPQSLRSGFNVEFELRPGANNVEVFLIAGPERKPILSQMLYGLDADTIGLANEPGAKKGPFPAAAIKAVEILCRHEIDDLTSEASQMEFVDRLAWLSQQPDVWRLPGLIGYFRFLRETWTHCQFVDRYFPARDVKGNEGDKGVSWKQSSSAEMMSIIHQLFVLHSEGVRGSFAEFGCFKGFSTSKLSYACSLLKIPMQVFDSFEGLPEDDSGFYLPGYFAGSLDEVTSNVSAFGTLGAVTFHKGFFAESLGRVAVPPLMALFMDVDLQSSATDVMMVANKLDPRGMIFSHECSPRHFDNGRVVPGKAHGGNVVAPIVRNFVGRGVPLSGRYIQDNTGAFWATGTAVPVAYNAVVMAIASKV